MGNTFYGAVSKDKFTKDGRPKRAGNFSKMYMHYQQHDYPVTRQKDGTFIIGKQTKAETVLQPALIEMLRTDKFFKYYRQEGTLDYYGETFPCWRVICKNYYSIYGASEYTMTMGVNTKGKFDYKFPEY